MNEKNSILNKYYRHKYEDDVSYLKTNGLKTHYVPGGLKLNSEYLKVTDRNFSQLAITLNDKSANKKLTQNQKSGLQALKKILQRGDGTFISPEIENKLLKKYQIEFETSPLPGDLKPVVKQKLDLAQEDNFLDSAFYTTNTQNLKISDKSWGKATDPFDSEEELLFFKYCKQYFKSASRWIHPQPKREFFNKPGTTEGREGVDFLFAPPWRKPVIIEILGTQHFVKANNEDFTNPLSSATFQQDLENLRNDIVDCVGIPAYEVRQQSGPNWDKIKDILFSPDAETVVEYIGENKNNKIHKIQEELWTISAFQNLFLELLQDKNLFCKKVWKLKLENNNNPTTGLDIFLNFVYSIMKIWDCTELMPEKILLVNSEGDNFKTYFFDKKKSKYLEKKGSLETTKANNLIYLDFNKTYLEKYQIGKEASYFFVRRVGFPFKIKDDRSFKNPKPYVNNNPSEADLKNILRFVFGKASFREIQYESIVKTLRGESSLVLLPTGSGKSLIYQLCSLILPGQVIVVSPTIALINNQHSNLNLMGVDKVASITMELNNAEEREIVLNSIGDGTTNLILCAPERLLTPQFEEHLKKSISNQFLSLGVIDEAHCISEWGQDFRTSYLGIGERLKRLSTGDKINTKLAILALTGTASITVRDDILNETNLDYTDELRASEFNRDELNFDIFKNINSEDKLSVLQSFLEKELPKLTGSKNLGEFFKHQEEQLKNNLVIIFIPTKGKKMADLYKKLKLFLNSQGLDENILGLMWGGGEYGKNWIESLGDSEEYKKQIPKEFKNGEKKIIIATKAFGMGIDFPNVRCVIHYGISNSIESWYQEAGRAGRDENNSLCWTLFSESDSGLTEEMLRTDTHSEAQSIYREKETQIKKFDDINTHLFFYYQQWKGLKTEIEYFLNFLSKNRKALLDASHEGRKEIVYKFNIANNETFGNNRDDQVINRLKVLGYLYEWQKDFSSRNYNLFIEDFNEFLKFKNLTKWLDRRMPMSTKGFTEKLRILGRDIDKKSSTEVIGTFLVQLNDFFPIRDEKDELGELSTSLREIVEQSKTTTAMYSEKLGSEKKELISKIANLKLDKKYEENLLKIIKNKKCNTGFLDFLIKQFRYLPAVNKRNDQSTHKQREEFVPPLLGTVKEVCGDKAFLRISKLNTDTKYETWYFGILANWELHVISFDKENDEDITNDGHEFLQTHSTGADALLICAYAYLLNATYKSVAFERRVKHLQVYELARNFEDNGQLQKEFTNYFADADSEFSAKLRQLDSDEGATPELWVDAAKKVKSIENAKADLEKYRTRSRELVGWFYAKFYIISKGNNEKLKDELDSHLDFFKESHGENTEVFFKYLKSLLLPEYETNKEIISYVFDWISTNFKIEDVNDYKAFQEILNHFVENFPDEVFSNSVTSYITNSILLENLKKLNEKLAGIP